MKNMGFGECKITETYLLNLFDTKIIFRNG